MAWHIDKAYAVAGRDAQTIRGDVVPATTAPSGSSGSMLHQLVLRIA